MEVLRELILYGCIAFFVIWIWEVLGISIGSVIGDVTKQIFLDCIYILKFIKTSMSSQKIMILLVDLLIVYIFPIFIYLLVLLIFVFGLTRYFLLINLYVVKACLKTPYLLWWERGRLIYFDRILLLGYNKWQFFFKSLINYFHFGICGFLLFWLMVLSRRLRPMLADFSEKVFVYWLGFALGIVLEINAVAEWIYPYIEIFYSFLKDLGSELRFYIWYVFRLKIKLYKYSFTNRVTYYFFLFKYWYWLVDNRLHFIYFKYFLVLRFIKLKLIMLNLYKLFNFYFSFIKWVKNILRLLLICIYFIICNLVDLFVSFLNFIILFNFKFNIIGYKTYLYGFFLEFLSNTKLKGIFLSPTFSYMQVFYFFLLNWGLNFLILSVNLFLPDVLLVFFFNIFIKILRVWFFCIGLFQYIISSCIFWWQVSWRSL